MVTVFILIDWFNPAYKAGGPVQSIANMVEQLQDGFSYKIFCSNRDVDGEVLKVFPDQWIQYNNATEVWYASERVSTKTLQQEIEKSGAEVLFINGLYSWNFNIKPILFCKAPRKIVSARGMLHPGALTQKKWKKKVYLAVWKMLGIHKKVEFHVSTEDEKKYVEQTFGASVKVNIASNFPRQLEKQQVNKKRIGELNLVSIGLISPMKNYLLVLQAIQKCNAQIHYHIYGAVKDEVYWKQCSEIIKTLPDNIVVSYHGDVSPWMVDDALSNGHVFILPSKSENFGHAIYEAFSAGKPVITSEYTPWNNLKYNKAGWNASIEKADELTEAILFFARMEQAELEQWSNGASEYSIRAIDVEEIKDTYRKMFLNAESAQSERGGINEQVRALNHNKA